MGVSVMSAKEFVEYFRGTRLLKEYLRLQKHRIAVSNVTAVEDYIYCPACRVLIPKPKRPWKNWDGVHCPRCKVGEIHEVRIEPYEVYREVENDLRASEKKIVVAMAHEIEGDILWREYLQYVNGIGPVMGFFLCKILRPSRFHHWSAMMKYCGLHVEHVCPKCGYKSSRYVEFCPKCGSEMIHRAPRRRRGEKVEFNPLARMMCWRLGVSFLRTGRFYKAMVYEFYRRVRERRPNISEKHAWNDALRRTVKLFLGHYWQVGRMLEGLPAEDPYPVAMHLDSFIMPVMDRQTPKEMVNSWYIRDIMRKYRVSETDIKRLLDWADRVILVSKKRKKDKGEKQ